MKAFLKKQETVIIDDVMQDYMKTNLRKVKDEEIKYIPSKFFCNYGGLSDVDFPLVENIGYSAFANCASLMPSQTNFPLAKTIEQGAFTNAFMVWSSEPKLLSIDACEKIGPFAFYGAGLNEVNFKRCSMISEYAFANMTSLKKASFSAATEIRYCAFSDCWSLETIDIGNVTRIESSAFANCYELSTINPDSVKILNGSDIFKNCRSLKNLTFQNCESAYGSNMFNGTSIDELYFPRLSDVNGTPFRNISAKTIKVPNMRFSESAFENAYVEKIELSNQKSCTIPSNMFTNCNNLKTIIGLDKREIVRIDNEAFRGCISLQIFDAINCEYIGSSAFYDAGIDHIDNLVCTYVGDAAFSMCSKLITANLPKISSVPKNAFNRCINLKGVNVESAEVVQESAFYSCNNLTMVNVSNCKYIYKGAFAGCISLSNFVAGKAEILGSFAFSDCRSLLSINIDNLREMGGGAFTNCISLSYVNIGGNFSVPANNNVFYGCNKLKTLEVNGLTSVYSSYVWLHGIRFSTLGLRGCSIVGEDALYGFANSSYLTDLENLYLDNCLNIGPRAFAADTNSKMTNLTIDNCKYIGRAAFVGYNNLSEIAMRSIETVEQTAFVRRYYDNTNPYPDRVFILSGESVASLATGCFADWDKNGNANYDKTSMLVPEQLYDAYKENCKDGLASKIFKIGSE